MSVRQYIGARYTIKVYENSLDPSSAEWEAGVTYEPLTLVTYLNSSYLSKKDVPGAIGDPAANPSYWVLTGAYNGQIMNLQNQIDTINAVLSKITTKKWILVGDSLAESPDASTSWMKFLIYELAVNGIDAYGGYLAGAGFGSPIKYLTALQSVSVPDPDEITDILVYGGLNDVNYLSDCYDGVAAFITYVNTTYPNAKVHYATTAFSAHTADLSKTVNVRNTFSWIAQTQPLQLVSDAWLIWRDYSTLGSDMIHPLIAGSHLIAEGLLQYCLGEAPFIKNDYGSATITFDAVVNAGNSTGITTTEIRSFDDVIATIDVSTLEFNTAQVIPVTGLKIASITTPKYIWGQSGIYIPITGVAYDSLLTPTAWSGMLYIYNGDIYLIGDGSTSIFKMYLYRCCGTIPMTVA